MRVCTNDTRMLLCQRVITCGKILRSEKLAHSILSSTPCSFFSPLFLRNIDFSGRWGFSGDVVAGDDYAGGGIH